jgi:hypothetical protein
MGKLDVTLKAISIGLSATGIGIDLYGIIDDKLLGGSSGPDPFEAVNKKLDQLVEGQARINNKLDVMLSEIKWQSIATEMKFYVNRIDYCWSLFQELTKSDYKYASPAAKKMAVDDFVDTVIDAGTGSIKEVLFNIHKLITEGHDSFGQSLFAEYKSKTKDWSDSSRSRQSSLEDLIVELQYIQIRGYYVLQAAEGYRERSLIDDTNPLKKLSRNQYAKLLDIKNNIFKEGLTDAQITALKSAMDNSPAISNFETEFSKRWKYQVDTANALFADLKDKANFSTVQSYGWGESSPADVFTYVNDGFIHLEEIIASPGCVLIGAQFLRYKPWGNRLAIQMTQAAIDGKTGAPVAVGSGINPLIQPKGWDKLELSIYKAGVWNCDYIDLPDNYVATGIKLHPGCYLNKMKFGDRWADISHDCVHLSLRGTLLTIIDPATNEVGLSTNPADTKWFFSKPLNTAEDKHSFTIKNQYPIADPKNKLPTNSAYAHMHPVVTDPLHFIVGGGLFKYNNRLAIYLTTASGQFIQEI